MAGHIPTGWRSIPPTLGFTWCSNAPDGLAWPRSANSTRATPDVIYVVEPGGRVEGLVVDPWADLLNRPSNLAFSDGVVYCTNLEGYHIGVLPVSDVGAPLHRPILPD